MIGRIRTPFPTPGTSLFVLATPLIALEKMLSPPPVVVTGRRAIDGVAVVLQHMAPASTSTDAVFRRGSIVPPACDVAGQYPDTHVVHQDLAALRAAPGQASSVKVHHTGVWHGFNFAISPFCGAVFSVHDFRTLKLPSAFFFF
jgi:hypothetical protein